MKIGVFRERILPYSETFIANQVNSLTSTEPVMIGLERVSSSLHINVPSVILSDYTKHARASTLGFKLTGAAPSAWQHAIREQRLTAIHAHFGPDGLWALPLAQQLKVPLVVTFHGYDVVATQKPLGRTYRYYQWRRKSLFRQASRIIAVSEFIRDRLIKAGCPPERITTHYIGVDLQQFQPKPVQREPVILYVGRLIEQKGVLDLIRSMPGVLRQHPQAQLVVIGSGPLDAQVREEATRHAVPCTLLGAQPPEQVRAWMNRAALLCVPARHEAFGLVYAEAQAMKLPVVAYAHAGTMEAVRHEVGGLLSPAGDLAALTQHLLTVLANPEVRDRLGAAGRSFIEENFDLQRQARALERIYGDVTTGGV